MKFQCKTTNRSVRLKPRLHNPDQSRLFTPTSNILSCENEMRRKRVKHANNEEPREPVHGYLWLQAPLASDESTKVFMTETSGRSRNISVRTHSLRYCSRRPACTRLPWWLVDLQQSLTDLLISRTVDCIDIPSVQTPQRARWLT